jgi:hypothetical protein
MPTKAPTSFGAIPTSRPISGASTETAVAATAAKIWMASVTASASAASPDAGSCASRAPSFAAGPLIA